MMDLPDINVWLALVDQNHVHHSAASQYWEENPDVELGFNRVSMLGLVRLGTLPGVLSKTLSVGEAWEIYRNYLAHPQIHFLAEPQSIEWHFAELTTRETLPHRLWTDAYLAAFAIASGCRMVSFDSDFSRFPGLRFLQLKSSLDDSVSS